MTKLMEDKTVAPLGKTSLHRMQEMVEEIVKVLPPGTDPGRGGPKIDDLKQLLDISQAINTTLELDSILEMVMTYAIRLVSAERGFIMLQEPGGLVMRQSHNLAPEQFGEQAERFSQTIANRVLEHGESIYTSDALEDSRFDLSKSVADLHLRSIMGVPLKHDGLILGLIYLDNASRADLPAVGPVHSRASGPAGGDRAGQRAASRQCARAAGVRGGHRRKHARGAFGARFSLQGGASQRPWTAPTEGAGRHGRRSGVARRGAPCAARRMAPCCAACKPAGPTTGAAGTRGGWRGRLYRVLVSRLLTDRPRAAGATWTT
jgi:hypothetical protein